MATKACSLSVALAFWSVLSGCVEVTALQQIFKLPDIQYKTFPTINVARHLPNEVIDSCKDFLWQKAELDGICPNGTVPFCVENNNPPRKEILHICKPTGNCDENARSIVYYDRRSPDIYWLGKKPCKGGYIHSIDGDCFEECNVWDGRIRIFKKGSPKSPAIVYCNYEYRYCNPEKPKLFALTRELNVCTLRLDKLCPSGMDRLPDCTCAEKCKNGFRRDPLDSFKCKKDAHPPAKRNYNKDITTDMSELTEISNLTAYAHGTGLRVSWCMDQLKDILLLPKHIEVSYRAANNGTANDLPSIFPEDDCQNVDIEHLYPGQKYILSVKFVFERVGKRISDTRKIIGKTRPKCVTDLKATLFGKTVNVEWLPPTDSFFDTYLVIIGGHRGEQRKHEIYDTSCVLSLTDVFPGDKYEITVCTVSYDVRSDTKTASVIYPPLPPSKLFMALIPGADPGTDRQIFWFKNNKMSYVEGYYISYTSPADNKSDVFVPAPHGQADMDEVVYSLFNLRLRYTYTISVKSEIGGVNSTSSTQLQIEIPPDDDDDKDKLICILIVAIVFMLLYYCGNTNDIRQNIQGAVYRIRYSHISGNITKVKSRNATVNIFTENDHRERTGSISSSSTEEEE